MQEDHSTRSRRELLSLLAPGAPAARRRAQVPRARRTCNAFFSSRLIHGDNALQTDGYNCKKIAWDLGPWVADASYASAVAALANPSLAP